MSSIHSSFPLVLQMAQGCFETLITFDKQASIACNLTRPGALMQGTELNPHQRPSCPAPAAVALRNGLDTIQDRSRSSTNTRLSSHTASPNTRTLQNYRKQAQIEVIELLSGGPRGGAQVLICKIVHAPAEYRSSHAPFPGSPRKKNTGQAPNLVVAKVFDQLFFEGNNEYICALFGNDVFAEQLLSRESGAYEYIYEKGKPKGPTPHSKRKGKRWENDNSMTGHPHLIPQYYGTWAVKIERGDHKHDCAGLVLTEYIEGRPMENLYTRDRITGQLHPRAGNIPFHSFTDSRGQVQRKKAELTEPFRLNVLRQIVHQLMVHVHIGLEHEDFDPENIFVTFRDHGAVDGLSMELFIGWFDAEWSEERFDEWLVQEFGPLEEGSAEGSTGKYSTFATLDVIEADKDEKMEEEKRLKMKAQQDEAYRVAIAIKRIIPGRSSPRYTPSRCRQQLLAGRSSSRWKPDRRRQRHRVTGPLHAPTGAGKAHEVERNLPPQALDSRFDPKSRPQRRVDAQLRSTESSFAPDPPFPWFGTPRSAQKSVEDDEEMGAIEEE
ncbi:hypothetical protein CSAL01_05888 [Colletotrichum salicis]|uniref:Protein kinase domain-containing protein n=1 Tax=Colletotrichum salicis TaxID=1209931 RepID=A0A135UTI9_9PEZI|nr:hypothetical protein CSAL01_05888 [Colletotrichum salicis]